MSPIVWLAAWQVAAADRRSVALRVLGLLAFTAVIATEAVPPEAASAAFVALFVGYGLLRAAGAIFGEGQSGLARRVLGGGVPSASYLLQHAAANGALCFVGLLPAVVVVTVATGAGLAEAAVLLGALAASLWIVAVMGVVIGAVSSSWAELLVLVGMALVLLLHMSGVFHTPSPDGAGALLEAVSPFRALHDAFASMEVGGRVRGGVSVAVWAVVFPGLVALFAPRLTDFPARRA